MKILIAVDQTAFWQQIINALLARTWSPGTKFKLLTVLEPLPCSWDLLSDEAYEKLADEICLRRQKAAEKLLADARCRLEKKFLDCTVQTELRQGRARDEVISAATDWLPDRLIIGAHGRSQNRLFPGSVSHPIAMHAPCSVELVRLVEPVTEVDNRVRRLLVN